MLLLWPTLPKSIQSQCNPYQNPTCLFCRNWWTDLKIPMEMQGMHNSQNNLVNNKVGGTSLVAGWLRLRAPNAGAQVRSLVRELDPTCIPKLRARMLQLRSQRPAAKKPTSRNWGAWPAATKTRCNHKIKKKKEQSWKTDTSWFQKLLQSYKNQNSVVLAKRQTYRSMEQN